MNADAPRLMPSDGFPRTVTIYGTGLMGCSLGLALRQHFSGIRVFGVDTAETLGEARRIGAIDDEAADPRHPSDLTLLAAPVGAILQLLETLPAGPGIILDVGSTKVQVCRKAEQLRLPFVGGHPMTGSERSGPEAASATMFKGTPFFLCAISSTPADAIAKISALVQSLGANPVVLEAEAHDRLVAQTSHLPQLLSTALADRTAEQRELAGPGWKSMTRLAASPFHVWRDILETSAFLPDELQAFIQRLEVLQEALRTHDETQLRAAFERANRAVEHDEQD